MCHSDAPDLRAPTPPLSLGSRAGLHKGGAFALHPGMFGSVPCWMEAGALLTSYRVAPPPDSGPALRERGAISCCHITGDLFLDTGREASWLRPLILGISFQEEL